MGRKIVPVLPEMKLLIDCKPFNYFSQRCHKCYFQPKKYLTVNYNQTNDHFNNLENGKLYITELKTTENCLVDAEIISSTILINSHCLTFQREELTETNLSNCKPSNTIKAKFIRSSLDIPNYRNIEMVYNIRINDDFLIFHKLEESENFTLNILNVTDLIGIATTYDKDISSPFKSVLTTNISMGIAFNCFNLFLITMIILVLLTKTKTWKSMCRRIMLYYRIYRHNTPVTEAPSQSQLELRDPLKSTK